MPRNASFLHSREATAEHAECTEILFQRKQAGKFSLITKERPERNDGVECAVIAAATHVSAAAEGCGL